ncbi:hypothetical protein AMECASPLE_029540 [Ameca splendens]|uniref:Uncharacterized protein n=1 Tax=Ameca splendens TaxID=208324 RepID=A0ABV0Y614_9TELE
MLVEESGKLRTALKSSFYEMSEEVSLTPLFTSDILRQQMISRHGLSSIYLQARAVSLGSTVEAYQYPARGCTGLQEFLTLVMDHIDHANVTRTTVETVTGARGHPMFSIDKGRLVELLELNLPGEQHCKITGDFSQNSSSTDGGIWSVCQPELQQSH